jgi:hypothetical protein
MTSTLQLTPTVTPAMRPRRKLATILGRYPVPRPATVPAAEGFPVHLVHDAPREGPRFYETLPATHEAMIWTAATWQLSNRLTR